MDLGIKGRKAIVCASSRGLGRACALALAEADCEVIVNGRDEKVLMATAEFITRATRAKVVPVIADVGTQAGRDKLLSVCPDPDILVNNNAGPPPKSFRDITPDEMRAGLDANMLTPIALVQATIDGMIARRFGRIINITSASVKMPLIGLDLSSGARAGLTGFLAGVAREVAYANVTINAILPGMFDTDRLASATAKMAEMKKMSVEQMRSERAANVPAKRFGHADEFGKTCAFIASTHAGYMTGQNILLDGGLFPSAF